MIGFPDDARGRELVLLIERAKYERWVVREVERILLDAYEEIVRRILAPTFRDLSREQRARLAVLFREIERQLEQGYGNAGRFALAQLEEYAEVEFRVARSILEGQVERAVLRGSSPIQLNVGGFISTRLARAVAELPVQGLPFGEWWRRQTQTMTSEVRRAIQQGVLLGEGPMSIVRRIVPDRAETEPAVWRRARNEAGVVVRTSVNAVQNHAAFESYASAGDEVTREYQWVAVRDSRTSAICRALDGKTFRYDDETAPRPPAHFQCRSAIVPVLTGSLAKALGSRARVPMGGFEKYDDWLRTQSESQQNAILGPTRAEWWRTGKMKLADAIDTDRRVLTLDQLRERLFAFAESAAP